MGAQETTSVGNKGCFFMESKYRIVTLSFILGLLVYTFFSFFEYLFIYGRDYWGIVASDMSTYEVFIRLVKVAIFIAFSVLLSKVLTGYKGNKVSLRKKT